MRPSKINFSSIAAVFGGLVGIAGLSGISEIRFVSGFEKADSGLRSLASRTAAENPHQEPPRLVFVTLDGVRPDEFFDCAAFREPLKQKCSFPNLWNEVRVGRFEASPMEVGNSRNLSLPGYQSIYSGGDQGATCKNNKECEQVPVKTWLESIKQARYIHTYEVAVIASWNKMPTAVEKTIGTITVNAGVVDMVDPTRGYEVPRELAIENRQQSDPRYLPPWENARDDVFTFRYARWYLANLKPHVLVVGLLNSDELAHEDKFDAYKAQLRTYDGYIQTLIQDLKTANLYDNTILFVTTDHGRGRDYFGYAFKGHGPEWYLAHSHHGWAAISVPAHLKPRWEKMKKKLGSHALTQRDIRPLIEDLMIPID